MPSEAAPGGNHGSESQCLGCPPSSRCPNPYVSSLLAITEDAVTQNEDQQATQSDSGRPSFVVAWLSRSVKSRIRCASRPAILAPSVNALEVSQSARRGAILKIVHRGTEEMHPKRDAGKRVIQGCRHIITLTSRVDPQI